MEFVLVRQEGLDSEDRVRHETVGPPTLFYDMRRWASLPYFMGG